MSSSSSSSSSLRLTNNATSHLAKDISATATGIELVSGGGALFPAITSGEWFPITVVQSGVIEIMKCTARSGNVLTVTRAQEGTTASAFTQSAVVELRMTADTFLGEVNAMWGALGDVSGALTELMGEEI